jgi:hypothetical protein
MLPGNRDPVHHTSRVVEASEPPSLLVLPIHSGCLLGIAMKNRIILCDCHLVPMQRDTVICFSPGGATVAWACDCGRYYCKSQGYFYIHRTRERIDTETSRRTPCQNEGCMPDRFMALVQPGNVNSSGTVWWYCFECRAEFAASDVTSGQQERLSPAILLKRQVDSLLPPAQIPRSGSSTSFGSPDCPCAAIRDFAATIKAPSTRAVKSSSKT